MSDKTPSPQSVVVPDPLWMMHVVGPDDIYPAPDHATAVQWCAYLNREIAPKVPSVLCVAVPAIWTGTAEEHAEGLAEAISGWTVPAAPAPSSLAGGEVSPLVQRLAYGYAIMHTAICHMAGTSGASGRWYYDKANEAFGRVSPIHSITEESNPHVNGDYFSGLSSFLAALSPEAPARDGGCGQCGQAMWVRQPCSLGLDPNKADPTVVAQCAALTPRHEAPADDGPVFHMNLLSHEDNEAWLESARRVASKHEAPDEGAGKLKNASDQIISDAMENGSLYVDHDNECIAWNGPGFAATVIGALKDCGFHVVSGHNFAQGEALATREEAPADAGEREALIDCLGQELADAYDCKRVWSAWSYGTMAEDDFVPVAHRIDEVADAILALRARSSAREDALREDSRDALADLASWFTKPVQGQNGMVWVIPAGERGADDAVNAALAALQAEQGAK